MHLSHEFARHDVCCCLLFTVGRELHVDLKPERDARVANRMIGAALGIRVPRKAPETTPSVAPSMKKPAVEYDSWDEA